MSRCGEAWAEMQNEQWPPEEDQEWLAWAEEQEEGDEDGEG